MEGLRREEIGSKCSFREWVLKAARGTKAGSLVGTPCEKQRGAGLDSAGRVSGTVRPRRNDPGSRRKTRRDFFFFSRRMEQTTVMNTVERDQVKELKTVPLRLVTRWT